jgi:hypothetical protein
MRDFVSGDGFKKMIREVLTDDEKNSQFNGEWTKVPLPESPFFADWGNIWKQLEPTYQNEFKSLVFSELPDIININHFAIKLYCS